MPAEVLSCFGGLQARIAWARQARARRNRCGCNGSASQGRQGIDRFAKLRLGLATGLRLGRGRGADSNQRPFAFEYYSSSGVGGSKSYRGKASWWAISRPSKLSQPLDGSSLTEPSRSTNIGPVPV